MLPRDDDETNDFGEDFDDANTEEDTAVAKSPRVTNNTDDDPSKTPTKPQPPNDDDPRRRKRRRRWWYRWWCFMMMMCGNTDTKGAVLYHFFPIEKGKRKRGVQKKNQTLKRVVICLGFYNFGSTQKSSLFFSLFFSLSIERTKERKNERTKDVLRLQ